MSREYIIVETKYGPCKIRSDHYINGVLPSIQSAINKSEYFANQSKELYGNRFDYSNVQYKNALTPVSLTCSIHGKFSVIPNSHLNTKRMSNCMQCKKDKIRQKAKDKNALFVEKANNLYEDKFDYSEMNYINSHSKIKIKCNKHNIYFEQIAKDHLIHKTGCEYCRREAISKSRRIDPTGWNLTRWIDAAKKSKQFDSFKIYIIECYNENERFIKIGRTYKSINNRFRTLSMLPYKYRILKQIDGDPEEVFKLENKLKKESIKHKYIPTKKFNGMYECFTTNILIT